MARPLAALGWFLSAFMVIPLTVICALQRHTIENDQQSLSRIISQCFLDLDRKLDLANSRGNSLMEALHTDRKEMKSLLSGYTPAQEEASAAASSRSKDRVGRSPSQRDEADYGNLQEVDAEISVPDGVKPEIIVSSGIKEILSDTLMNPANRKLGPIEIAEAMLELDRAQGDLKVLDREIALEVARAIEALRAEGNFIEYGPDEKYQTVDDVLTAAELLNGRTRMFYLYPEQFSGIYDRRERKALVAETATRRLLSIIRRSSQR